MCAYTCMCSFNAGKACLSPAGAMLWSCSLLLCWGSMEEPGQGCKHPSRGLAGSLGTVLLQSSAFCNLGAGFICIHFKGINSSNQYLEVQEQLAEHFIHLLILMTTFAGSWRGLFQSGFPGSGRRQLMSIANQDACCNVPKNVI